MVEKTTNEVTSEVSTLELQSTLVISKLKGPSETLRDIRSLTYQIFRIEKKQIAQLNFTNEYSIRLLYSELYIENFVEKGRNCSSGAISPLFHNIFIDNILLPDLRFKHGPDFLFEISGCSR